MTDLEATVQILPSEVERTMLKNIGEAVVQPYTEYACSSHIGTRENQQDYIDVGTGNNGVVFGIVCDGMGGLEGGEIASRTAGQAFASSLIKMDPNCDIPAFLATESQNVNRMVFDISSDDGGSGGAAGTTIVAAVIVEKDLYWLSIGDSRIYIIRGHEIETVTRDHSYSMELEEYVRCGNMTAEEAAADPMKDALISYLGINKLWLIDSNQKPFVLEPGDIVLLCSDGLYRSLSDRDIMDIIQRHCDDIEECARVLPLYAYDRAPGGQDNTSVVLIRVRKSV